MSVLAEAISIIVRNETLDELYPGGVYAYARDCPNETFCTDGDLTRVGFMSHRDARFFLDILETQGLECQRGLASIDVAVVDQNLGPLLACLWLEFGRTEDCTACCWLSGEPPGALHVPRGWECSRSPLAFRYAPDEPFSRRLRYLKTEENLDWYQDRASGEVFHVGRTFNTH